MTALSARVGVTLAWLTCFCIRASLDASICWCVTGFVTILEAFSDSRFDRRQMGLSIRVSSRGLATGSCSPASLQGIMALGAIFLPRDIVSCCVVGVSRNSPPNRPTQLGLPLLQKLRVLMSLVTVTFPVTLARTLVAIAGSMHL